MNSVVLFTEVNNYIKRTNYSFLIKGEKINTYLCDFFIALFLLPK